ncbi:MAG TPA: VWA domain-containing protein [Terriglobales bacterium]|nr:VWA domain-containing protein [Terriglobales bacterium]
MAALLLLPPVLSFPQNSPAPELAPSSRQAASASPAGTLRLRAKPLMIDVDLVEIPVTVTDIRNRPVLDLQETDFSLLEDGEQQQIRYFSRDEAPLTVGVLLDLSRSMRKKIGMAREAVSEFFKNSNPDDDFFVITFDDKPRLLIDTTQSIGTIESKLVTAVPDGHTALLDAIYMGVKKARSARHKRRALLIISDGADNNSRYRADEIRALVQEADVEIYAIDIYDSLFALPEDRAGRRLLTHITEATGGRTCVVDNISRLPEAARAISTELRSRYLLGYRPSRPLRDGRYRKINVRVQASTSANPLQVYFRRGYFSPSE